MTRSHDAGVAAGSTDVPFAKLGDQSFALQDATGGTTVYFRRSGIVAYLVAVSTVTPTELQQAATAVDLAIAGAAAEGGGIGSTGVDAVPGGVIVLGSPGPSSAPGSSVGPGADPDEHAVARRAGARGGPARTRSAGRRSRPRA